MENKNRCGEKNKTTTSIETNEKRLTNIVTLLET